jgi:predicted membrane protein
MNNHHLCYTSLLLVIPFLYGLFHHTSWEERILLWLLILTLICSQLFWNHPIQHSTIHKIDAIVAKIAIFSFIFYTLWYKFKVSYLFVLLAMFVSFYLSHHYSSQEWCSTHHVCCHGSSHIFCFIATFYAFIK